MKSSILTAAVVLGISAFAIFAYVEPTNLFIKRDAETRVRVTLRDPASAVFKDEYVVNSTVYPTVCGQVNSKNGYGGMAGYSRFFSNEAITSVEHGDKDFDTFYAGFCTP